MRVDRLDGDARTLIGEGVIGANGLLDVPTIGETLPRGTYEATFHIGDWLRSQGVGGGGVAFLDLTPFRFGIDNPQAHYHLPFKFTPWGFSCFRGGA